MAQEKGSTTVIGNVRRGSATVSTVAAKEIPVVEEVVVEPKRVSTPVDGRRRKAISGLSGIEPLEGIGETNVQQAAIDAARQTEEFFVPKTKFHIPYPNDKDFTVQTGSTREAELTKKGGKPGEVFEARQFTGLSFEQISQAMVLQATITREPIAGGITRKECVITLSNEPVITTKTDGERGGAKTFKYGKYGDKVGYYTADGKERMDIPETEGPGKFSISRKVSRTNKLAAPLKKLEAALKKDDSSPEERLNRALQALDGNMILADIKSKYSNQNLTPTYALYCLEQELQLVKEQINAYDNATKELGAELANPSIETRAKNKAPAENFIENASKAVVAFKGAIPEMAEDFKKQFRGIITDVNAVETFQTSKKVDKLVFAEKFPAIEKFKSQILTESELLEVMGGKRLSGQQADLLHQIEDVIMNDNARSKVRGLLDTGMGKTFLAEKIAKYSEILKRKRRVLPSGFSQVPSFEIKNIDLANQDQLLEMEQKTSSDGKPLKGTLIIVDEDFFISKKSLRTLVDKGAKVVRFGASENQLQLIEAFHRAEDKNIAGAKIKKNEALITMLESKKEENSSIKEIYEKLEGSYKRQSKNDTSSHMLASFNYTNFREAISELETRGLIRMDEAVQVYLTKIEEDRDFTGRKNTLDQSHLSTESAIRHVIQAVSSVPQIEISRALLNINNARNDSAFENAYADLTRLGVFEGLDHEISEFLSEAVESKNIGHLKTNALPAIKYAAEKKMLSLNSLESDARIDFQDEEFFKESLNKTYLDKISKDIDAQISSIRAENERLREPNQIFDSKVRIRENDIQAVAARRDLAKTRLEKAAVKSADEKPWYQLAIENSTTNKSQNIFPGLSLQKEEIEHGLGEILAATGKDVAVANFVEGGKHKIILAKKNARGAVEYTAIANDGNKDARIEELTKGTTSAVMNYAGENLEFVVGGDYGHLSLLAESDRQNIFIKRLKDLNIDLFKQMFGRDRAGLENIVRTISLMGEVAGLELTAKELADKSFVNVQEKDLSTMVQFLQTKLQKYYKQDAASQEKFATTAANILENSDETDLASLIVDRRVLTDQVSHQLEFLHDDVDQEKFRRDLKALAFYSLASRAVNEGTDLRAAFAEVSLNGFTVPQELKSIMETSDAVSTLDNLQTFSNLLHLKKEVHLEIKSENLDKLKREALAPKRAFLLEAAGNMQSLIADYAKENPEIVDNLQAYKVEGPTLVTIGRNADEKVDGFVFYHGGKEGQRSYKFTQDGIHLSGEEDPLTLKEVGEISGALESSLEKMQDLFAERQVAAMQAVADSAQGLQNDFNAIANSELQENLGGRFVIESKEVGDKKVVTAFTVGVDADYGHRENEGKYVFEFDDENKIVGLYRNEDVKQVFLDPSQIEKLQSILTVAQEIAQKAVDIKQAERARIAEETKVRELEAKLQADEIERVRLQELATQEQLKIAEIAAQVQAANELRDILKAAFDSNEYQNSGLNISKTRDEENVRSFSIKKDEEVLEYEFVFDPKKPKSIGLNKLSNEAQNSQEIKAVQESVKAELERVREVKRIAEEQAREAAERLQMSQAEAETQAGILAFRNTLYSLHEALLEAGQHSSIEKIVKISDKNGFEIDGLKPDFEIFEGDLKGKYEFDILDPAGEELDEENENDNDEAYIVGVSKDPDGQELDLDIDQISKLLEFVRGEINKAIELEDKQKDDAVKQEAKANELARKSRYLLGVFKKIDESLLEFSGISKVVKSDKKEVQSFSLMQDGEQRDYQFILSGRPLVVTGVKNGETDLSADEIDKLAKAIEAEITKANAKKLAAETAAKMAQIIAKGVIGQATQGLVVAAQAEETVETAFNSVMQKLIDEEAAKKRALELKPEAKVERAEPELEQVKEQKGKVESEAVKSILTMLQDNAYLNKYLSSENGSKLIDVDVSPRVFLEDPMSFVITGDETSAGKYEFSMRGGGNNGLTKNDQPQNLEEIKAVQKLIEAEISKAVATEYVDYEKAAEVRDSGTDDLTLEQTKVLLEHELTAINKSHQPLTDEEVAAKVELIATNDLHNLGESDKPLKDRKTEFFNSDKVMRTLAKVHAISELQGEKVDWQKAWDGDKSLNLDLTRADKSILAMLGMNDAGVKEVFGSIEKPRLVLNAIDDVKRENIMNVASKFIAAIGPEEIKKYSGKEVEAGQGIKKFIAQELEKGVAGRSLNFGLETEEKLATTPQPSVEKAQAWKVSLVDRSHTLVGG
ncbi:MAG: hypothetical protein V4694_06275 [Pseudomonadota bacterium]